MPFAVSASPQTLATLPTFPAPPTLMAHSGPPHLVALTLAFYSVGFAEGTRDVLLDPLRLHRAFGERVGEGLARSARVQYGG